jgi:hypothetical protein
MANEQSPSGATFLTAAAILARLILVDGAGTGLDADLLDGQQGFYYQNATNINAGLLAVGFGGTGLASYTIGDLIYASGTTMLAKLADVATGNALISGGVGVAPSWGKVALTTHVSGILPVANGGTNSSTALSGSSIMVSNGTQIVQGAAGTTTTVLHGNPTGAPSYGAVSLTADISGLLPVANGGTNLSSYAVGDLIYASGATTLASRAAVASGAILTSNGVGAAPTWSATPTITGPVVIGTDPGGSNILRVGGVVDIKNGTAVGAQNAINIIGPTSGGQQYRDIVFNLTGGLYGSRIRAGSNYDAAISTSLEFLTTNGAGTTASRLLIDTSGAVIVGTDPGGSELLRGTGAFRFTADSILTSATDATSTTAAALVVSGGVGIAKKLYVGSTTSAASSTTGALVVGDGSVTGSVGVGSGRVMAGGNNHSFGDASHTSLTFSTLFNNGSVQFMASGAANYWDTNIRPNSGKSAFLSFTENGVADRWSVGIVGGDGTLYFSNNRVASAGTLASKMALFSNGNVGVGVTALGASAVGVIGIANGTAPSTSPASMGQLYVESGALKYRGSSGTVTTLGTA